MPNNPNGYNVNGTDVVQSGTNYVVITPSTQGIYARSAGVNYQNDNKYRVRLVSIDIIIPINQASNYVIVYCDENPVPTVVSANYGFITGLNTLSFPLVFFVPPNFYYRVDGNAFSYNHWVEYNI